MAEPVRRIDPNPDVDLTVSAETVCFLIVKAREFDVKEEVTEPDPGSNPTDDLDAAVLEDHKDDPTEQEIRSTVDALSIDEQLDVIALVWLGRGDYDVKEWRTIRNDALETHSTKVADYLLGQPLLGDLLEEGLSLIGRNCEEFEVNRL